MAYSVCRHYDAYRIWMCVCVSYTRPELVTIRCYFVHIYSWVWVSNTIESMNVWTVCVSEFILYMSVTLGRVCVCCHFMMCYFRRRFFFALSVVCAVNVTCAYTISIVSYAVSACICAPVRKFRHLDKWDYLNPHHISWSHSKYKIDYFKIDIFLLLQSECMWQHWIGCSIAFSVCNTARTWTEHKFHMIAWIYFSLFKAFISAFNITLKENKRKNARCLQCVCNA